MTGERIVMPRKLAAIAAVLALAGVFAGCSRKLTTDPSLRVPEGTRTSQLELYTYFDGTNDKIRIKDGGAIASVDFGIFSLDSVQVVNGQAQITSYRNLSPGVVHGVILNRTGSEELEVWRSDPNGGVRQLFDFTLKPVKRWMDRGTRVYEFYDTDASRSPNATYYVRGLVGGFGGASSPVSNPSTPSAAALTDIRYFAERYGTPAGTTFIGADSNITMQWNPVPGADRYLIQIFQYGSQVLTLDQRILTGAPAPLLLQDAQDVIVAEVPGSASTQRRILDPGITFYTYHPLRMRTDYYIRISAMNSSGGMIAMTKGPTIRQTSDLSQVFIWHAHFPEDYFADFSADEVTNATPPAYLLYSRGAIWVSPGSDPSTGGGASQGRTR